MVPPTDWSRAPTSRIPAVMSQAARAAGNHALEGFRSAQLTVRAKSDKHDLVTDYDRRCEDIIRDLLLAEYPQSTVIGEEAGLSGTTDERLRWYVDPIDGTAAYATGLALWCVCIGAELDGRLVAGAVFDPVAGHMFLADDRGATLNGTALRAAGRTHPSQATVIAHFPWPRDLQWAPEEALNQFREVMQTFAVVRSLGSGALAMCHIAAGWADATFHLGASVWDVAASSFILQRAGGHYAAYTEGQASPPARAHLYPNYVATVAGADFPLLHDIVRHQSGRDAAHPKGS